MDTTTLAPIAAPPADEDELSTCWFGHAWNEWRVRQSDNDEWTPGKTERYRECRRPDCDEFQVEPV